MSKKAKGKDAEAPSYVAATEELNRILGEIEAGDVDVDVLSEKVERAAMLIRVCNEKISGAELKVHRVLEGLEDVEADDAPPPEADAGESAAE